MRNSNERVLDSGIYARLREVQMSAVDRRNAMLSLAQAEQIAKGFLWLREKASDIGHWFLKPSLKH